MNDNVAGDKIKYLPMEERRGHDHLESWEQVVLGRMAQDRQEGQRGHQQKE